MEKRLAEEHYQRSKVAVLSVANHCSDAEIWRLIQELMAFSFERAIREKTSDGGMVNRVTDAARHASEEPDRSPIEGSTF